MRARPWFWRMTLASVALALLLGLVLLRAAKLDGLSSLHAGLTEYRFEFALVRLTIIAVLAGAWPALIRRMANHGVLDVNSAQLLHDARWRMVAWLLALEMLLGLNLLNSIVRTVKAVMA